MSWSWRSWLVTALIVVPLLALKWWLGVDYPSWISWFMIGLVCLLGSAILVSPDLASMRRPASARLLGVILVSAAALNAYFLFTETSPE